MYELVILIFTIILMGHLGACYFYEVGYSGIQAGEVNTWI